ncbi:hypothetical protein GJ654_04295 [Rhodoblastus acidophilus]|uniref:MerR HTH family regulatory protein n=1 Tax=Rhodoblastus acidophilus TaxID=1074 RepID=A0A6N8DIJ1_RHOAC|nr:hypothetical protein [Rhodoblastus acidophilus]MCW2273317.1 hypothetical protein [Rhodoblastus acidophilus]MTV30209.1 hypothetical protein [Rhodoblastus acidophilus]
MNAPLDIPKFSTADVANAAGIPVETLRTWVKRGDLALIHGTPDRFSPGVGRTRQFTLRRALNVVLTAELVRNNLSVKEASQAALNFTDIGEGVYDPSEDALTDESVPARDPGELFRDGETVLVVRFPKGGGRIEASVERLEDAVTTLFSRENKEFYSAFLVDLDAVHDRANSILNKYHV